MFGFIKMIENFLRKLRTNKRAWFSTIFLVSITGIGLSLYLLITLTDAIAEEVYQSQAREHRLKLRNFEQIKEGELKRIAVLLSSNSTWIAAVKSHDVALIDSLKQPFYTLLEGKKSPPIEISFYTAGTPRESLRSTINSSFQSKNDIFGIEVLHDGVFYVYLMPILEEGEVIGVVEIKESIYAIKENFNRLGKTYLFILDGKMLSSIAVQFRDGVYEEISQDFFINKNIYDSTEMMYAGILNESAIRTFNNGGYLLEKEFYLTGTPVRDSTGVVIGLVIFGENANEEGGFVGMSNKMSQQVIMVALGLIVSLLLFMF
ncbi:MAG: hypothetical protein IBX45_06590 [Campylobacterales bacterium]|nr:hypothetical protein [Campylobacterales bacterium]